MSDRRERRTQAEIDDLCKTMISILEEDHPMTVRQVFYRMVSVGAIEKSEAEYKNTICRLLARLRLDEVIPFFWIADNTRWQRKPTTFSSLAAAVEESARAYRRAVWQTQPAYVEVWLEKEALAGVLIEETSGFDVPLMVTKGYASLSYLKGAAEAMEVATGYGRKPAVLYYFGDLDPSGMDITRNTEERLREFAPTVEIYFRRVAVTAEQVHRFGLSTRPTKRTDSRSKGFQGESVEVDAIPPRELRRLTRACIEEYLDPHELAVLQAAEDEERDILQSFIKLVA